MGSVPRMFCTVYTTHLSTGSFKNTLVIDCQKMLLTACYYMNVMRMCYAGSKQPARLAELNLINNISHEY